MEIKSMLILQAIRTTAWSWNKEGVIINNCKYTLHWVVLTNKICGTYNPDGSERVKPTFLSEQHTKFVVYLLVTCLPSQIVTLCHALHRVWQQNPILLLTLNSLLTLSKNFVILILIWTFVTSDISYSGYKANQKNTRDKRKVLINCQDLCDMISGRFL